MECLSSNHTPTPAHLAAWSSDHLYISLVKVLVLTILFVLILVSNIAVILRVTQRSRKWMAVENIMKTLAGLGLANGLLNVLVYLITTCSGQWVLGGTLCQIHGVFGTVIINSWTWVLTIAAFERYVKLLTPSDHASFFSEVNTKIMVWGCVLLLFVIYLGPVYGWGEYSFLRGKIDLTLGMIFNMSDDSEMAASTRKSAFTFLGSLLHKSSPSSAASMTNLMTLLCDGHQLTLRRPHLTPAGLVFPLRAPTRAALQCLWSEFEAGHLVREMRSMVTVNDSIPGSVGGAGTEYDVKIDMREDEYSLYSRVHMPFQEGATCSLDYSDVNQHVYSFVGFTGFVNLILPAAFMTYCYVRLFSAGLQKICMFSRDGISPEDGVWTRVFTYTGFTSLLCHLPFTLCSLCSGRGIYVPTAVHFGSTVLLYFSTCLLACFYLCATRLSSADYEDSWCGFRWWPSRRGNMNVFGEIHQRLLSRPSSTNNSPYRPAKTLTANLTLKCAVSETQL